MRQKKKQRKPVQGTKQGGGAAPASLRIELPRAIRYGDRAILGLLIVLVGALPFVWNPYAMAPTIDIYIGSKELFAKVVIALLVGIWIVRRTEVWRLRRSGVFSIAGGVDRSFKIAMGAAIAVALVSVVVSSEWQYSFRAFLGIAGLILLLFVVADAVGEREARSLAITLTVAASLIALQAALQYFNLDPFRGAVQTVKDTMEMQRTSVSTQVGQVTMTGSFLAMALPVSLALAVLARTTRGRLLALGAFALQMAGLVATSARGPLSGALAGLAVFVAVLLYRSPKAWKRAWKTGAVVLAVSFLFIAMNPTLVERTALSFEKYREGDYNAALNKRYVPWRVAWQIFRNHPLLGTGLATFQFHYNDYVLRWIDEGKIQGPFRIGKFAHVHNEYLQILQEMGVVGLAGFAGVIGYWFFLTGPFALRRRGEGSGGSPGPAGRGEGTTPEESRDANAPVLVAACLGSLVVYLIIGVTTPLFHFVLTSVVAAVLGGVGYSLAGKGKLSLSSASGKPKPVGGVRPVRIVAVVGFLLVGSAIYDVKKELSAVAHQEAGLAVVVQFYQGRIPHQSIPSLFSRAAEQLEEALRLDPTRGKLYSQLGMLYAGTRQWDKAIASLERADRYDKGNRGAIWTNLGYVHKEIGEYDKAKSYYERAIRYFPGRAQDARDGLGEVEFLRKVKGE
jgi:Tfp pilus assembly protein PilF